jgi:hypothetical protein
VVQHALFVNFLVQHVVQQMVVPTGVGAMRLPNSPTPDMATVSETATNALQKLTPLAYSAGYRQILSELGAI